jgi:hypothetical protein
MKIISIFTKTQLSAMKIFIMLTLALAITDCATTKKNFAVLKIKSTQKIQQNHITKNPNVHIEKDLIQADFQGKLRSSLNGSPFNTAIWSSNCDCR